MNRALYCSSLVTILIACSDQVQPLKQPCTLSSRDRVDRGFVQHGREWSRVLPVHTEGCGLYGALLTISENFVDSSGEIEICNQCEEPMRLNWFVESSALPPRRNDPRDLEDLLRGVRLLIEAIDRQGTVYMVGCIAPPYTDRQQRVYQAMHLNLEPNEGFVASLPFNPLDLAYAPPPEAGIDFVGLDLSSEMKGRMKWPKLAAQESDELAAHPMAICEDIGLTAYLEHRVTSWIGLGAREVFSTQDFGTLDFPDELLQEIQSAR